MRLLVLGPNGQLGTDLVAATAEREGFCVTPFPRASLDVGSLNQIEPTLRDEDFDVLVNCTSYHDTDEVEKNATKAFTVNAHAVERMAKVCAEADRRFVHVSTDYVFSGVNQDRPYREDDPPSPINVYGASKAMGERLALRSHDDVLIARVAALFGIAGSSGKGGNFVETMLRVGEEKGELQVVDDQRVSPTATADVAEIILDLLSGGAERGVYHVVNSGDATWYEFADEIIERAGVEAMVKPIPSSEFPTVAARPIYSVLDNSKAERIAGSIPTWRDSLERYLEAKGHV